MRKKSLVLAMVLAMSTMVVACGGPSKEDYLDDVQAIVEMGTSFENLEDMAEFADVVADMDVTTKEGKVIKEDMEELAGYMEELSGMMEDLENADQDRALEIQEKVTTLQEDVEDHVKAFEDAAKDAGVEDEDLEDIAF